VNIRELKSHDLQLLLGLYAHLHKNDDPPPSAAIAEAVWSEALANPRIKYFGGFVSDSLVSSCTLTVIPNLTRACRPYGVIEKGAKRNGAEAPPNNSSERTRER
jgi:hypothetical protein